MPASGLAAAARMPVSVAECDRVLALLRVAARTGGLPDRGLARIRVDDVLDRRLELTEREASCG